MCDFLYLLIYDAADNKISKHIYLEYISFDSINLKNHFDMMGGKKCFFPKLKRKKISSYNRESQDLI